MILKSTLDLSLGSQHCCAPSP